MYKKKLLKEVCPEIFYLYCFHDSNPSGPLINRLKYFHIIFLLRPNIQIFMKLHGVHPTAESIPTVCIIPQSRVFQILKKKNPPCAPHRRVNLRGVHPTAETISRCASYRGDNLCCVHLESKLNSCLWLLLKGQSGQILPLVNTFIMKEKIWSI